MELDRYLNRLRRIPAGQFVMGSVKGDSDERPVRRIRVNAFQLGMTPVTVGMWQEYCLACGLDLPPKPRWGYLRDHPVVNVSWNDIMGADGNGGFCA
jgi:formylglycine-generating enzyme required for sulfatase activity